MPVTASPGRADLPAQPFFTLPGQRVALARERFFELGERPTGLVSEAVIQSWSRCLGTHRSPGTRVAFEPVTRSRLQATLERQQHLLRAARDEIARLEAALAGSGSRVLLTDAQGVVVHATAAPAHAGEAVLRHAARLGVNLAEGVVGTNAPAVVVKTGCSATVQGAEHFLDVLHGVHCAAAPIRDGRGQLAGVLDLSVESRPFAFDAAALVGVYATLIENQLLQASASDELVLQFQVCPSMLDTALQALLGVDGQGRICWMNGTAQHLLGLAGAPGQPGQADALLGASPQQLLALSREHEPQALHLPNGLRVWTRARLAVAQPGGHARPAAQTVLQRPAAQAVPQRPAATALPDHAGTPAQPSAPVQPAAPAATAATLDHAAREHILHTLAACGGNLSRAARSLGVSRGLLYRRLSAMKAAGA